MSNVDYTENPLALLCLCPGILGLERGLERAVRAIAADGYISFRGEKAFNVVAYVEIEAFIIANLVGQMEAGLLDPAPIWTNVKTFDARPFRDRVHGIIGGYPCQPFSNAGERRGVEDERHLWPHIYEQVEIIRPQFVFFENVAGHLSLGYEEVRRSLSNLGYRVEEGIFTAEEVGAPHRRERLFILGVMENASIIRWRRWRTGGTPRNECETKASGSGTALDNANSQCEHGFAPSIIGGSTEPTISSGSVGMANTDSSRRENIWDDEQQAKTSDEGIINSNPLGSESGVVQDDTFQQRLQGYTGHDSREGGRTKQERPATEASLFPAGQGTFQYEWEEPRTIESSLVYTIDRYNFTEDLHRAIGNSVVEQTAELAFLTLLDKHIKNM